MKILGLDCSWKKEDVIRRAWDIKGEFFTYVRFEQVYRSRGRYQFRGRS